MGLFGKDDHKPADPQPAPRAPRPASTPPASSAETTLIGRAAQIEGTLSGSADMLIEGKLRGTIDGSGRLVVAESGRLEANLHARVVIISGTVTGDVSADERIELKSSATLTGNITAPRIQIHEGATFQGEVRMATPDKKATAVSPAASGGTGTPKAQEAGKASPNAKNRS